jgi:hypothetical protein
MAGLPEASWRDGSAATRLPGQNWCKPFELRAIFSEIERSPGAFEELIAGKTHPGIDLYQNRAI